MHSLLLLFVGSGCAALIYEIVWFQLLQLVIGSSAVSLGVLLGTFMGGMCLGSLLLPRLVDQRQNPLRVYAVIETGIGVIGILVLFIVPLIGSLYAANVLHGFLGILFRAAICAVCLLPPTLLMGATLPAIARQVEPTREGVSWLGFFYAGNIAGAVFGCLLAGFYLLRVYDMATATYVAAAINFGVAGVALLISAKATRPAPAPADTALVAPEASVWPVYVTIALSGLCALGAEVVWTRILSLLLGASVYTFSIILAVFLIGLGIGSSVGSVLSKSVQPRAALGYCQLLVAFGITWTSFMVSRALPYWPVDPSLSTSPWITFQFDFLRCLAVILPSAILWGASFPLALASVAAKQQDAGRMVGQMYAANTVGAIAGAMAFSILIIPWLGTQDAQRLLIVLAAAAALFALGPSSWQKATSKNAVVDMLIASVLVFALAWRVPEIPGGLVAYGRFLATKDFTPDVLYMGEGMNASVAVTELAGGIRNFHVSGKIEASTEPQDMRLQRMLGHLSALAHPQPKSVLIVGFGAGVTAGSFVLHPSIEKIVICEIEPLIPQVVSQYFAVENYSVLTDPRTRVVYDDARHYILTTDEKFDVITSDPIHPWVKGAATLYTKEYFELAKKRLNPGGVITQWVPLYESTSEVVKSELGTFFEVFPGGTIWSNDINGEGYDTVLLGSLDPLEINLDAFEQRLERPDHAAISQSLREAGFARPIDLLATYAGNAGGLQTWLADAELNLDRSLRLQYLAGLGLNLYQAGAIYKEIVAYRSFPSDFFTGSPEKVRALMDRLSLLEP